MQDCISLLSLVEIKAAIKSVESTKWINIKVKRRDGKSLPCGKRSAPVKADYVAALKQALLSLSITPTLPTEVLLFIFSMDFSPRKFSLVNKEMNQKTNTELFYKSVCEFRGYSLPLSHKSKPSPLDKQNPSLPHNYKGCASLPLGGNEERRESSESASYKTFFLQNIDASNLMKDAFQPRDENSLCFVITYDSVLTSDGVVVKVAPGIMHGVNIHKDNSIITSGQARHILEEFYIGCKVDIPKDPSQTLAVKPCTDPINHKDCCRFNCLHGGFGRNRNTLSLSYVY